MLKVVSNDSLYVYQSVISIDVNRAYVAISEERLYGNIYIVFQQDIEFCWKENIYLITNSEGYNINIDRNT